MHSNRQMDAGAAPLFNKSGLSYDAQLHNGIGPIYAESCHFEHFEL